MMMKKILFLCLAMLFIVSCSTSDDSNDDNTTRELADLEADFQALNLQAGINDVSIKNLKGDDWNFRVIIPESASTTKRPLVITLHGAAGGDENAHKATACYAEPGFEAIDPIILSPNGGTRLWDHPFNQDQVIGLIYLANKFLNTDKDKVVVNGYSNGGNGSWLYAELYPEIFRASIPMASSYNTYSTTGNVRNISVPLYVIHGEEDELFPLADTQEWVQALQQAGGNVTLDVAPGLTHTEPCNYVPYLKNAAEWLQEEVWD